MDQWFLKSAKYFRNEAPLETGDPAKERDTYKWIWHSWPENIQEGVITICEPPYRFSFTFEPAGVVEIEFIELSENETEVVLTQSEILTDGEAWYHYFYGCSMGWSFWLVNLKAYLEHGVVLDQRSVVYSDDRRLQMVNQ